MYIQFINIIFMFEMVVGVYVSEMEGAALHSYDFEKTF